jgi:hypothetical protein
VRTEPAPILSKTAYSLEFEDDFTGNRLEAGSWIPYYLPQWSSRTASAARYALRDGALRLLIEADQPPWCPEFDGWLRVSSLQTGVFSGPRGSEIGQCHFREGLVVREEQQAATLYTPRYGLFEARAKAIDDPTNMVALWMIGFEDEPQRTAEICVFEIFGRDVKTNRAAIGMGLHPFGDHTIIDEFSKQEAAIDAREFHTYAAEWTPDYVAFYVDARLVKVARQSPQYQMQLMLGIYEFRDGPALPSRRERYPKEFIVDWVRGYRAASSLTNETAVARGRDLAAD